MKKHFVGLPLVLVWTFTGLLAGVSLFIWITIDLGQFVPLAFIAFLIIPIILEVILIVLFCQYIIIDDSGIKKYNFLGRLSIMYEWKDIQEVRINAIWIYVSLQKLVGKVKEWNSKKYIYLMCSKSVINSLQQYLPSNVFNGIENVL